MARGRKANDGRGRLGGRKAASGKDVCSIKEVLREHSLAYFVPSEEEVGEDGRPTGKMVSRWELDLREMKPADRIRAELDVLQYHTSKMQAVSAEVGVSADDDSLVSILGQMASQENAQGDEE